MKWNLRREFCLWVVSPNEGKVRKVRFSPTKLVLVFLMAMGLGGVFTFIASDYARLQVLRFKSHLALRVIENERSRLLAEKSGLQHELKAMEIEKSRVISYEEGVKERLKKLSALLKSSATMGLLTAPSKKAQAGDGIGGAESDCDGDGCGETAMARPKKFALSWFSSGHQQDDALLDGDLLAQLDEYISIVESMPLIAPCDGHISSGFGYRVSPFTFTWKKHEGVDFSERYGSPVIATGDGIVASVESNRTYGRMIDIQHNPRLSTRFAHLSKVMVKEGQRVTRGTVIGLVGSSGHSTGPHLHYEVRLDGRARNPMSYIALARKFEEVL
jgi:murein DD-endopeptidase MepM/ murein hydrolase activator NlpD